MKRHITLVLLLAAALAYLKTQRPMLYNQMLLNGTLWPHLQDAQKTACAWLERTMTTLLDKSPRAGQRARTASLGGAHERAESAGGRDSSEGSRQAHQRLPDGRPLLATIQRR